MTACRRIRTATKVKSRTPTKWSINWMARFRIGSFIQPRAALASTRCGRDSKNFFHWAGSAAPIVAAFEQGLRDVEPIVARETIAESIQVGNPVSLGWRALAALHESKGTAVALRDEEILQAQSLTGHLAGLFAEPAAATSVAAAKKLRDAGVIGQNELVVCNLTGHGLKQPGAVRIPDEALRPIAPTLDALRAQVRRAEN